MVKFSINPALNLTWNQSFYIHLKYAIYGHSLDVVADWPNLFFKNPLLFLSNFEFKFALNE